MLYLTLGLVVATIGVALAMGEGVASLIGLSVSIDVAALTLTQYTVQNVRTDHPLKWALRHASWHAGLFFIALGGVGYISTKLEHLFVDWKELPMLFASVSCLSERLPNLGVIEFFTRIFPAIPIYLAGIIAVLLWGALYYGRLTEAAVPVDGIEGEAAILEKMPKILTWARHSRANLFAAYVALDMWFLVPTLRRSELVSKAGDFDIMRDGVLCLGVFAFVLIYTVIVATLLVRWVRERDEARQGIRFAFVYVEPLLTGYFVADVLLRMLGLTSTARSRIEVSFILLALLLIKLRNIPAVWNACKSKGTYWNRDTEPVGVIAAFSKSVRGLRLPRVSDATDYVSKNAGQVRLFLALVPLSYTFYTAGLRCVCDPPNNLMIVGGAIAIVLSLVMLYVVSKRAIVGINSVVNLGPAGLAIVIPLYLILVATIGELIYPSLPWAILSSSC